MLLTLCLLLGCTFPDSVGIYSGRERQLNVRIPRFDADVVIDGDLGDSAWAHAALLTGFSQFAPNDGVPAADSTQVLVWYSPNAIYFGIRAFESHGRPTMTLANRDQIFGDDNVQILLGTFHDAKQVLMFAVNPLGVQGDGSLIEGANATASGFIGGAVVGREQPDLSPDFVYQSRGRLTDWGYEVEVRIPFKSLRYQARQPQDWSINVLREVKHSGFEDSWYPARRANASFIAQSGTLSGLTGMDRGLVVDLNPEATGKASGALTASGYQYDIGNPQVGGNVRWGVSDNLTLNGTIKPDFSQVESDAGQLAFDPRQALFFPEKRPFFLAGSRTRAGGVTTTAPLWLTQFTIQHRIWGLRSVFAGIGDDFRDASGFIGRAGIVHSYVDPSWTTYGRPRALLQRFTGDIVVDGIWQYQNFIHGRHMQDKKLHFNGNATLRGGCHIAA